MTATTTELSIAFSSEELAALTGLMNMHHVPGSTGGASWAPEVLESAGRSLRARGVISADGDAVADPIIDLLTIVTAPQIAVDLTISPATAIATERRSAAAIHRRYALTGPAGIEQIVSSGVHRFIPFASVEVLARIADATGLTRPAAPMDTPPTVTTAPTGTEPALGLPVDGITVERAALVAAVQESPGERRATGLRASGLAPESAMLLGRLLDGCRFTVSVWVRRVPAAGRVEGIEVGWAATDRGLISWPMADGDGDPWREAPRPVTIRPFDIRAALADLASAVTPSPAGGR